MCAGKLFPKRTWQYFILKVVFVITSHFTPSSVSCLVYKMDDSLLIIRQETVAVALTNQSQTSYCSAATITLYGWNGLQVLVLAQTLLAFWTEQPRCILDLNQFADHYRLGRVSMPENLAANDSFWHQIINCIDYARLLLVQSVTLIVILNWR